MCCYCPLPFEKVQSRQVNLRKKGSRSIFAQYCLDYYIFMYVVVQSLSHVRLFATPRTVARKASLCITISRVCSNSCPLSWWCCPTISSSVIPFSSCLQSFPALGFFPMSQFFASGGQSIGASASASVLPMTIQGWFPWGLTGLISLHAEGLSKVFSNTTVWKHQFFSTQPSCGPTLTSVHDFWKKW